VYPPKKGKTDSVSKMSKEGKKNEKQENKEETQREKIEEKMTKNEKKKKIENKEETKQEKIEEKKTKNEKKKKIENKEETKREKIEEIKYRHKIPKTNLLPQPSFTIEELTFLSENCENLSVAEIKKRMPSLKITRNVTRRKNLNNIKTAMVNMGKRNREELIPESVRPAFKKLKNLA